MTRQRHRASEWGAMTTPRRQFRRSGRTAGLAATAVLLATLTACGGGDGAEAQPAAQPTTTAAPEPDAQDPSVPTVERNAFPAYIKHTWGTTQIDEEPKRIVSLGMRDHEMLIALGVTPIAIRNAFGSKFPYADWPWVPDRVQEGQYQYLSAGLQEPKTGKIEPPVDGPVDAGGAPMAAATPYKRQIWDYELLKSLKPDLIVGAFSGITQEDYLKLVEIAPTITDVSAEKKYYYAAWQEQMLALGKATGRPQAAQRLIDSTEAHFATLRDEHPEFKDATVALVAPAGNGRVRVINPYAPMARFFTSLRMRFPSAVDSLIKQPGSKATYGVEMDAGSLPIFSNVDALVWIVGKEGSEQLDRIRNSGYYQSMNVVQRGAAIYMTEGISEAVYFTSPYSVPWALEKLKPGLLKALERKANREAAIDSAAERAADRAEKEGDFVFQYGDPTASPKPRDDDEDMADEPGATWSPTPAPSATSTP
jgi:iron complex transport system substrate-binding protein